jgi:hypothetical protein
VQTHLNVVAIGINPTADFSPYKGTGLKDFYFPASIG